MKKFFVILVFIFAITFSYSQKLKKLGIEIDNTTFNFGDIQMWENQPAMFTITNNSKQVINILPLFSENDLEVIYPEGNINPGESFTIKAIYYTSGTGSFSRSFPIYFNISPEAYYLKIAGNIKNLSPTAYIQCPQAKPEHSKSKVDLFGDVAEIVTEIPLENAQVKLIGVTNKINLDFVCDKKGNFTSKLPIGNYEILVHQDGYEPHTGYFYLGQNTGHVKVRLTPIGQEVVAQNTPTYNLVSKEDALPNELKEETPTKVSTNEAVTSAQEPTKDTPIKEAVLTQNKPIEEPKTGYYNEPEVSDPKPKEHTPTKEETTYINTKEEAKKDNTIPQPNSTNSYNKEEPKEAIKKETPKTFDEPQDKNELDKPNSTTIKEDKPKPSAPTPPPPASTVPVHSYAFRIIDEKTMEPIENAEIIINNPDKNKPLDKLNSNSVGLATIELPQGDYALNIDAPNYLSKKAVIYKDDKNDIIRIYLSPVGDLFEDIYAAKKKEQEDDLLNKLSFGKTTYTPEKEEEIPISKTEQTPETSLSEPANKPEPINPVETTLKDNEIENTPKGTVTSIAITPDNSKQRELDSIQEMLAKIQEQNKQIEMELAKAKLANAEKENELLKKEAALASNKDELAKTQTELAQKEQALEEAKKQPEVITPVPTPSPEKVPSLELARNEYAANNVLFLIDISSSMGKENKMELLKESMKSLTTVLRDIDRVAIIAYNQKSTVVLEGVPGNEKDLILQAIDSLQNYGLTYGVTGLQTAYELLEYYYIGNGNNQIILATDGLFSTVNATMTESQLNKEVRKQAENNNIKLSVVGFGKDEEGEKLMIKLAEYGNGQYIKIRNPWEAREVLVNEIKLNSKL